VRRHPLHACCLLPAAAAAAWPGRRRPDPTYGGEISDSIPRISRGNGKRTKLKAGGKKNKIITAGPSSLPDATREEAGGCSLRVRRRRRRRRAVAGERREGGREGVDLDRGELGLARRVVVVDKAPKNLGKKL